MSRNTSDDDGGMSAWEWATAGVLGVIAFALGARLRRGGKSRRTGMVNAGGSSAGTVLPATPPALEPPDGAPWKIVSLEHVAAQRPRARLVTLEEISSTWHAFGIATDHDAAVRQVVGWMRHFESGLPLYIQEGRHARELFDVYALCRYLRAHHQIDIARHDELARPFEDAMRLMFHRQRHGHSHPRPPSAPPAPELPPLRERLADRWASLREAAASRPATPGPQLIEHLPADAPVEPGAPELETAEFEAVLEEWLERRDDPSVPAAVHGWIDAIQQGRGVWIRRPFETVRITSREGLRRYILERSSLLDIDEEAK